MRSFKLKEGIASALQFAAKSFIMKRTGKSPSPSNGMHGRCELVIKRWIVGGIALIFALCGCLPAAYAQPESGTKALKVAVDAIGGVFNPIFYSDAADGYACNLMFSSLCARDEEGNVVFGENTVADSVQISDDYCTYTFALKEDISFSNGEPLTAADVVFTIRMIAYDEYDGPLFEMVNDIVGCNTYHVDESSEIEGLRAVDEHTFEISLQAPNPKKLMQLCDVGILSEKHYAREKYADMAALHAKPVGSGPYVLGDYAAGKRATLVRNEHWFGEAPAIDQVELIRYSQNEAIEALGEGTVDLMKAAIADSETISVIEANGGEALTVMALNFNAIMLNHQSPKLADKRVRQALMFGYDRQRVIDEVFDGQATYCLTPVYPCLWLYPSDDSDMEHYDYAPERARRLLTEAGWIDSDGDGIREKDGQTLSLTLQTYDDTTWPGQFAEIVKESWAQIGVELTVKSGKFATVMQQVYGTRTFDDFDMWTQGLAMSDDPDMLSLLGKEAFEAEDGLNPGGYINDEAERLMTEAALTHDEDERAELYEQWAIVINDSLPMLFNVIRYELWGVRAGISGLEEMNPLYDWSDCIFGIDIAQEAPSQHEFKHQVGFA